MHTLTRTAAAISAVALCGLAALPPAHAAGAGTTFVDYDQNVRTLPAGGPYCAFPVERVLNGRISTRTSFTADGTETDFSWASRFSYVLRNPANGHQLTSALAGTEVVTTYPDGTITDVVKGNDLNFTAPGVGRITGYVGLEAAVIGPDGSVTLTKRTHNMADSVFPAACAYLA
jgi:hypothetical protein